MSDSISLPDDSLRDDSWPGGSWTDDLPTLLRLSRLVAAADPDGRPRLDLVYPQSVLPAPRRLAFLAGSFNPPHSAHLAMSRAALDAGFDRLVLTLSKRTVDKASVTGLGLADRLLLLRRLAEEQSRARGAPPDTASPFGVALLNRGLYVDQAEILREFWPTLDELAVVLGFDKIVQVFDPRYYADRDAALDRLFALATVLVAPRAGADSDDLAALLTRPENRRFAHRVRLLPIPPDLADISSSGVREAGGDADPSLPPAVRAFLTRTRAYASPERRPDGEVVDAYGVRLALLAALSREASSLIPLAEPRLLELARADGPAGRAIRAWLAEPAGDLAALLQTLLAGPGGAP